jgi:hypothetical protein
MKVETAQQDNTKVSDSCGSPNDIRIAEDIDVNEEVHAEEITTREAQLPSPSQGTSLPGAFHVKHDQLEWHGSPEKPQLAPNTPQDLPDREKHQALQRCQASALSRTSAQSALAESHARELEIRKRRLAAARTVAQTIAGLQEARTLREAAERRETAAMLAHQEAAKVLVEVEAEAEGGRRYTCDALSQLHVALEEEYKAQLDFFPV